MAIIEIFGVLLGFIYLFLEYRAHQSMWLVSMVMALVYIVVYFKTGLFAYMTIYGLYFWMSLYGAYRWKRLQKRELTPLSEDEIVTAEGENWLYFMPKNYWIWVILFSILMSVGFYYSVGAISGEAPNPFDSIIGGMSLVAMGMLTQKWVEQWILLIIVNAISIVLFWQTALYYTLLLHGVYFIISFFGYLRWCRVAKAGEPQ